MVVRTDWSQTEREGECLTQRADHVARELVDTVCERWCWQAVRLWAWLVEMLGWPDATQEEVQDDAADASTIPVDQKEVA